MDLTMRFGGAAYGTNASLPYEQWGSQKYVTVFTDTEIICYDLQSKVERKYPIKFIPSYEARVSMYYHPVRGLLPTYSFEGYLGGNLFIYFVSIEDGSEIAYTGNLIFGGSNNLIETTFSLENNNLKAVFKNGEYVFK